MIAYYRPNSWRTLWSRDHQWWESWTGCQSDYGVYTKYQCCNLHARDSPSCYYGQVGNHWFGTKNRHIWYLHPTFEVNISILLAVKPFIHIISPITLTHCILPMTPTLTLPKNSNSITKSMSMNTIRTIKFFGLEAIRKNELERARMFKTLIVKRWQWQACRKFIARRAFVKSKKTGQGAWLQNEHGWPKIGQAHHRLCIGRCVSPAGAKKTFTHGHWCLGTSVWYDFL